MSIHLSEPFGGCACSAGKSKCDCIPTKQCPPCHGDCKQGDECPAEPPFLDFTGRELLVAAIVIVGTVIVGVWRQG